MRLIVVGPLTVVALAPVLLLGCNDATTQAQPDSRSCDVSVERDRDALPDVPTAPLQIGTTPDGATTAEAFVPAADGALFTAIAPGLQPYMMIMVAAATRQLECWVDRVNVSLKVGSRDGLTVYGEVRLRNRRVTTGADGVKALLNVGLTLDPDTTVWNDQPALLRVELEPYGGGPALAHELNITLTR